MSPRREAQFAGLNSTDDSTVLTLPARFRSGEESNPSSCGSGGNMAGIGIRNRDYIHELSDAESDGVPDDPSPEVAEVYETESAAEVDVHEAAETARHYDTQAYDHGEAQASDHGNTQASDHHDTAEEVVEELHDMEDDEGDQEVDESETRGVSRLEFVGDELDSLMSEYEYSESVATTRFTFGHTLGADILGDIAVGSSSSALGDIFDHYQRGSITSPTSTAMIQSFMPSPMPSPPPIPSQFAVPPPLPSPTPSSSLGISPTRLRFSDAMSPPMTPSTSTAKHRSMRSVRSGHGQPPPGNFV